ncbi:MAG: PepSY-associated TM helix domain-containing protein [Saprospiraceae bacterium]
MPPRTRRQQQAGLLRTVRKIHRWTGASLFVLFVFISITGLLLGWKKETAWLLPATQKGVAARDATRWLSLDTLQQQAVAALQEAMPDVDAAIDRIDVRPDKGIAKFTFQAHYHEVQLDMATGQVLSIALRRSDWLEQVHDGSIMDRQLGLSFFKLLYTSVSGVALLVFTVTGFWLWYGPKRMRTNE